MTTQELLARARQARGAMALADTQTKDRALLAMAEELEADTAPILAANALDLEGARGRISEVMLDRLALSPDRIAGMAKGIREVAALPDPVGAVLSRVERPNGLVIEKTAVPMGVIAIIYERPAQCHQRRRSPGPEGGLRLCAPLREGGPPLRRGHRLRPVPGPLPGRTAPGGPVSGGRTPPGPPRTRADDRQRIRGPAHPPGGARG